MQPMTKSRGSSAGRDRVEGGQGVRHRGGVRIVAVEVEPAPVRYPPFAPQRRGAPGEEPALDLLPLARPTRIAAQTAIAAFCAIPSVTRRSFTTTGGGAPYGHRDRRGVARVGCREGDPARPGPFRSTASAGSTTRQRGRGKRAERGEGLARAREDADAARAKRLRRARPSRGRRPPGRPGPPSGRARPGSRCAMSGSIMPARARHLARRADARLDDRKPVARRVQAAKRQGDADLVVEVALGRQDPGRTPPRGGARGAPWSRSCPRCP